MGKRMEQKKAKPSVEYFMGYMYKGFCGECGKLLWTGAKAKESKPLKRVISICPHCKVEIDWSEIA